MTTGISPYLIKLIALVYLKVPIWTSRGYRLAGKRAGTNSELLQFENAILGLAGIGLIGTNEPFDALISTRCGLPFRIKFLHALDGFASLTLQNCETRLLPRRWFDPLTINDDTGKTTARSVLRVLCARPARIRPRVGNDPWVAPPRVFAGPLSSIRITPRDPGLMQAVFAPNTLKKTE